MKIKSLTYRDDHDMDNTYTVGKNGVKEIFQHSAQGEGDKWFYDVKIENETIRVFHFEKVIFED